MKIYRTARTAFTALRRNPMRALLTTLGIVIGVGAVIAMMEIGAGSSAAIQKTIASMGANVLLILPGTAASGGVSFGAGTVTTLTPEDGEAILRDSPAVRSIAPIVRARTQVVYGNRNWVPQQMIGTTAGISGRPGLEQPGRGRDLHRARRAQRQQGLPDRADARPRTVPGRVARRQGNPRQERDLPRGGCPERKGGQHDGHGPGRHPAGPLDDDQVPGDGLHAHQHQPERGRRFQQLGEHPEQPLSRPGRRSSTPSHRTSRRRTPRCRCASPTSTRSWPRPAARRRFRRPSSRSPTCCASATASAPGEPDDFTSRDMTEMTNTLSSTTRLMTNLLLCVAMISLVVGGVGIMNIMLVSVTERTREIGLRMAVGARARDILRQFLVEAVVLCLVGGSVGILLGHGGSRLVRTVAALARRDLPGGHCRRGPGLGRRGDHLRLLPGMEGVAAGPHRGPALRVMTSLKGQLRRCASSRGRCGVLHVRLAPQDLRALTLAFERRHPKRWQMAIPSPGRPTRRRSLVSTLTSWVRQTA